MYLAEDNIIKALECCTNPQIGVKCPRAKSMKMCNDVCANTLMEQALYLIKHQKKIIEKLQSKE